ncbi:MAG: FAD-dependent oxidoreductase, partial [Pseudonocardiaceae bacterium]
RVVHARLLDPALTGAIPLVGAGSAQSPLPIRLLQRFPLLQAIPATAVGIGLIPEHAPAFARGGSSRTTNSPSGRR